MFFNWTIQRHFLHKLELTIHVESYFIVLVETTTDIISGVLSFLFKSFFKIFLNYFLHRLYVAIDVE